MYENPRPNDSFKRQFQKLDSTKIVFNFKSFTETLPLGVRWLLATSLLLRNAYTRLGWKYLLGWPSVCTKLISNLGEDVDGFCKVCHDLPRFRTFVLGRWTCCTLSSSRSLVGFFWKPERGLEHRYSKTRQNSKDCDAVGVLLNKKQKGCQILKMPETS